MEKKDLHIKILFFLFCLVCPELLLSQTDTTTWLRISLKNHKKYECFIVKQDSTAMLVQDKKGERMTIIKSEINRIDTFILAERQYRRQGETDEIRLKRAKDARADSLADLTGYRDRLLFWVNIGDAISVNTYSETGTYFSPSTLGVSASVTYDLYMLTAKYIGGSWSSFSNLNWQPNDFSFLFGVKYKQTRYMASFSAGPGYYYNKSENNGGWGRWFEKSKKGFMLSLESQIFWTYSKYIGSGLCLYGNYIDRNNYNFGITGCMQFGLLR